MSNKPTYAVPNGFTFQYVTNEREAKRLARQQPEGSQWYEREVPTNRRSYAGMPVRWETEYRNTFRNGKWSHR